MPKFSINKMSGDEILDFNFSNEDENIQDRVKTVISALENKKIGKFSKLVEGINCADMTHGNRDNLVQMLTTLMLKEDDVVISLVTSDAEILLNQMKQTPYAKNARLVGEKLSEYAELQNNTDFILNEMLPVINMNKYNATDVLDKLCFFNRDIGTNQNTRQVVYQKLIDLQRATPSSSVQEAMSSSTSSSQRNL